MLNLQGNYGYQNNDISDNLNEKIDYIINQKFDLIEHQKGDVKVIAPKGQLNNASMKFFRKATYAATDEYGCKVIFNLRFVDSIDSVGLGILIAAHKNAEEHGGMIVFTDMDDRIFNLMKMLNMDKYLNFSADMKGAKELMEW